MKEFLLAIALLFSISGFSQDTPNHVKWEDTSATKKVLEETQRFLDSMKTANMYKESTQGLDNLLRYQKEQREKQRKRALLYIGLGIFFLVVLLVSIFRRTKGKSTK